MEKNKTAEKPTGSKAGESAPQTATESAERSSSSSDAKAAETAQTTATEKKSEKEQTADGSAQKEKTEAQTEAAPPKDNDSKKAEAADPEAEEGTAKEEKDADAGEADAAAPKAKPGKAEVQPEKAEADGDSSKQKAEKPNIALSVLGVVLCAILAPILALNVVLIIQGFTQDASKLPNIGGKFPLMVQSGSMSPTIEVGDLIIAQAPEKNTAFKKGDVITFWDGAPGGPLVTHRIAEVTKDDDGKTAYRTKGDANSAQDAVLVYDEDIVGVYVTRIPYLGDVAMFMQTIPGLVVCVILPLALFVVYDVIRRRKLSKSEQEETAALLAELERLKAEKNKENQ